MTCYNVIVTEYRWSENLTIYLTFIYIYFFIYCRKMFNILANISKVTDYSHEFHTSNIFEFCNKVHHSQLNYILGRYLHCITDDNLLGPRYATDSLIMVSCSQSISHDVCSQSMPVNTNVPGVDPSIF